jgi:hypothetical protein
LIARLVFKRPDDFDPGIDPIVRIQAVRLRRSLERYYLLSGHDDPVRIELPRGGYIPLLRWATPAERPSRPATPDSGPPLGVDDWPVVAVHSFECSAPEATAAARLREELATELGRYQDVRVVLGGRRAERPRSRRAPRCGTVRDVDGGFDHCVSSTSPMAARSGDEYQQANPPERESMKARR